MNILVFITRLETMGGAQKHVLHLARYCMENHHQVTVVGGGRGQFSARLEKAGVRTLFIPALIRRIHPVMDALAFRGLLTIIRKERPDILACHSSKGGIMGRLATRLLDIPCVFTVHGWAFTEGIPANKRMRYLLVEKAVAPLSRHIISVSRYDIDLARKYRLVKKDRITHIPNGVPDIPPASPRPRDERTVRLCMVARFDHPKDHRLLLEALAGLRKQNWELDCIGSGPLLPEIRTLAGALGLDDRIHFHGYTEDVTPHLLEADIFVLVSNWEGLPCAILEAMQIGLPIIASDVGGISEAVVHGENGFLVPRGSRTALRKQLRRLMRDPVLRNDMGIAGRKKYEQSFTFTKMAEKTLAVYRRAIRQHTPKV